MREGVVVSEWQRGRAQGEGRAVCACVRVHTHAATALFPRRKWGVLREAVQADAQRAASHIRTSGAQGRRRLVGVGVLGGGGATGAAVGGPLHLQLRHGA